MRSWSQTWLHRLAGDTVSLTNFVSHFFSQNIGRERTSLGHTFDLTQTILHKVPMWLSYLLPFELTVTLTFCIMPVRIVDVLQQGAKSHANVKVYSHAFGTGDEKRRSKPKTVEGMPVVYAYHLACKLLVNVISYLSEKSWRVCPSIRHMFIISRANY